MRLSSILAALAALLACCAGPAQADDSALSKDGYWTVGRGDAEATGCMASISDEQANMLLIQVAPGHVDFVVGKRKPVRRGKAGVLTIDGASFEFRPDYSDDGIVFFEDPGARAFAALRTARAVIVEIDGHEVLNRNVANTGLDSALDAVVACSKGESGWWGLGVGASRPKPAVNKENVWFLERSDEPGICTAYALASERTLLVMVGYRGEIGLAVKSDDEMRRGRKGMLEADSAAIAFKPIFDGPRYFSSDQSFDGSALAALRNAKDLRVSLDSRVVVDASVGGTGLAAVLDDLAACSKGEKGWWGEGARR